MPESDARSVSLGLAQAAAVTSVVWVCTLLGPGSGCCSYIYGLGLHTAWAWLRLLQLHLVWVCTLLGPGSGCCSYICGHTAWAWLRLLQLHLWSGSAHSLGLAQAAAVTSEVWVCTQLGPGSGCCSYICGLGLHTAWAWLRLLQLHLRSGSAHSLGLAQAAAVTSEVWVCTLLGPGSGCCSYICGLGLHTAWAWLRLLQLHLWSGSAHCLGLAQAAAVTSVVWVCTQLGPGSGCCSYICGLGLHTAWAWLRLLQLHLRSGQDVNNKFGICCLLYFQAPALCPDNVMSN